MDRPVCIVSCSSVSPNIKTFPHAANDELITLCIDDSSSYNFFYSKEKCQNQENWKRKREGEKELCHTTWDLHHLVLVSCHLCFWVCRLMRTRTTLWEDPRDGLVSRRNLLQIIRNGLIPNPFLWVISSVSSTPYLSVFKTIFNIILYFKKKICWRILW